MPPENGASGVGSAQAGFMPAAEFSVGAAGAVGLTALGPPEPAEVAATLVGVPLHAATTGMALAFCWRCASGSGLSGCAEAGLVCWTPPCRRGHAGPAGTWRGAPSGRADARWSTRMRDTAPAAMGRGGVERGAPTLARMHEKWGRRISRRAAS